METQTPASAPARTYDTPSLVGGTLCVASLVFEWLGWLIAIAGIVLLPRSGMRTRTKWLLAALALLPRVLFVAAHYYSAPRGVSFDLEPRTLATSFSLWTWSSLLAGFGVLAMSQSRPSQAERFESPNPDSKRRPLLILGLVLVVAGAVILLEPFDGFQRIEDAGNGRWALKHAARGTRATFAREEVSLVEGTEHSTTRGAPTYAVRVTLADGRSYSVSARTGVAFTELRRFATTAGLRPGTVRITPRRGAAWTNGATGFTLKDFVGTYECADAGTRERRTIDLYLEGGRLAGKETVADGATSYVRALRSLKVSDTGGIEFDVAARAAVRNGSDNTTAFSLQWGSTGEDARLTRDGLEVGTRKYRRR